MRGGNALLTKGTGTSSDLIGEDGPPATVGGDTALSKKRKIGDGGAEESPPALESKGGRKPGAKSKAGALSKSKKKVGRKKESALAAKKPKLDENGEKVSSHPNLSKRCVAIGKKIREMLDENYEDFDVDKIETIVSEISAKTHVKTGIRDEIFGDAMTFTKYNATGSQFEIRYRAISYADETFSTSTVADVLLGVLPNKPSDEVMDRVVLLLELVSVVRVPTKFVGAATEDFRMAHPSAIDEETFQRGMFGKPGTALTDRGKEPELQEHWFRDMLRKQRAVQAMEKALDLKYSAERIIIEGLRAAIVATSDHMMAPGQASNVQSHLHHVSEADYKQQGEWRETLKDIHALLSEAVGEPVSEDTQREDALWSGPTRWTGSTTDILKRAPSAFRKDPAVTADPMGIGSPFDALRSGADETSIVPHLADLSEPLHELPLA